MRVKSETSTLQHTATHCNALQHTAAHCNALQRTATHCNALQRTLYACQVWDQGVMCSVSRIYINCTNAYERHELTCVKLEEQATGSNDDKTKTKMSCVVCHELISITPTHMNITNSHISHWIYRRQDWDQDVMPHMSRTHIDCTNSDAYHELRCVTYIVEDEATGCIWWCVCACVCACVFAFVCVCLMDVAFSTWSCVCHELTCVTCLMDVQMCHIYSVFAGCCF